MNNEQRERGITLILPGRHVDRAEQFQRGPPPAIRRRRSASPRRCPANCVSNCRDKSSGFDRPDRRYPRERDGIPFVSTRQNVSEFRLARSIACSFRLARLLVRVLVESSERKEDTLAAFFSSPRSFLISLPLFLSSAPPPNVARRDQRRDCEERKLQSLAAR